LLKQTLEAADEWEMNNPDVYSSKYLVQLAILRTLLEIREMLKGKT